MTVKQNFIFQHGHRVTEYTSDPQWLYLEFSTTPCSGDTDVQFTGEIGVTLCSSGTVVSFTGEIDVTLCSIDTDV